MSNPPLPPSHHRDSDETEYPNSRTPQPARPSNGVTIDYMEPNNPYHRGSSKVNRSKSMTRPERQRPRTNMIHNNNQASTSQDDEGVHRRISFMRNRRKSTHRPLSTTFTQQRTPSTSSDESIDKKKDEKVLTSWWAWIAFLVTCCIPPFIIRTWFGKTNKGMQQAWREKVNKHILI